MTTQRELELEAENASLRDALERVTAERDALQVLVQSHRQTRLLRKKIIAGLRRHIDKLETALSAVDKAAPVDSDLRGDGMFDGYGEGLADAIRKVRDALRDEGKAGS